MSEMYEVFTITEREGAEKKFWRRLGTGFKNKDGSFNIYLEGLPPNGQLHMRLPREDSDFPAKEDKKPTSNGRAK